MSQINNKNILDKIEKKEPRNKGITLKITNSEYLKISGFCKKNNIKMADLLNIKIKEIINEIN